MGTDDYTISFKTINERLDDIHGFLIDNAKELGALKANQEAQGQAIQRVEEQVTVITAHYTDCPAMEEIDDLADFTGQIETDVEALKTRVPSKPPQSTQRRIDWAAIFTPGNVKLMLLIGFVIALTIAVGFGVAIPKELVQP